MRLERVSSSIQFFVILYSVGHFMSTTKIQNFFLSLKIKTKKDWIFPSCMKNLISVRNLNQTCLKITAVEQFYCCTDILISRYFDFSTQLLLLHRFKIFDILITSFYFTFVTSTFHFNIHFAQIIIDILHTFVALKQFFLKSQVFQCYISTVIFHRILVTIDSIKTESYIPDKIRNTTRRTDQLSGRSEVMGQFRLYRCKGMPGTAALHMICNQASKMCTRKLVINQVGVKF